jgi:hypothetical protein
MLRSSLHVLGLSGLAVVAIYLALLLGEALSMSRSYGYLHSEIGVPVTLLRIGVLAITVLPAAFLAGRHLVLRLRKSGRTALLIAAVGFALIIGLLQVFVYEWSVLGASLLKVAFASAGLILVANRYRRLSIETL